MTDRVLCPQCGTKYNTEKIKSGARVKCRKCDTIIVVRDEASPTAETIQSPSVAAQRRDNSMSCELSKGQVIGRCKIERLLGRGGMGVVYLAHHTQLDIPVAVKILPTHVALQRPDFAERFLREARVAARIRHGNVVSVFGADKDEATNLYFIEMEYVGGGSVHELLDNGPVAVDRAIDIVRGVAAALKAASEHTIIHRDIKPDNIMLTEKGEVKLADMGLAKQLDTGAKALTMISTAMGTPAYMSPEQAEDSRSVDARADIYSLGATLYHLLTGSPPFSADTVYRLLVKVTREPTPDPRELNAAVPDGVAEICLKMMAKKAEDRYQTADELLSDLAMVNTEAPASPVQPVTSWRPGKKILIGCGAVTLLFLLLVVAGIKKDAKRRRAEGAIPESLSETQSLLDKGEIKEAVARIESLPALPADSPLHKEVERLKEEIEHIKQLKDELSSRALAFHNAVLTSDIDKALSIVDPNFINEKGRSAAVMRIKIAGGTDKLLKIHPGSIRIREIRRLPKDAGADAEVVMEIRIRKEWRRKPPKRWVLRDKQWYVMLQ